VFWELYLFLSSGKVPPLMDPLEGAVLYRCTPVQVQVTLQLMVSRLLGQSVHLGRTV